jgi:hypothetical protein
MNSQRFEQYRNEVKHALLARKRELDQVWDPFIASWLVYAFMYEQDSCSLSLHELFQRLDAWSQEESAWQFKRNVGPLFFLAWLRKQKNFSVDETYIHKVLQLLQRTLNPDDRFSPLRSSDQIFLVALGVSTIDQVETKERLRTYISSQIKRTLLRRIMYSAALKEIGGDYPLRLLCPHESQDIADLIAILWWLERENHLDKSKYWERFAYNIDTISLYKVDEFNTRRFLLSFELALLFEALVRETANLATSLLSRTEREETE